jgi:alkylation response protein AidB-like acyl-CoA dehydrogenase
MAQSLASDAYCDATHRSIQVFGAIGFTWEMKNHLYFKRARGNAALLGAPQMQREAVARILEARVRRQQVTATPSAADRVAPAIA